MKGEPMGLSIADFQMPITQSEAETQLTQVAQLRNLG